MQFKYRTLVQAFRTTTVYPYPEGTEDLGYAAAQALTLMKEAQKHERDDGIPRRVMIELLVEEESPDADHEVRADSARQLTLFPDQAVPSRDGGPRGPTAGSTSHRMGPPAGED